MLLLLRAVQEHDGELYASWGPLALPDEGVWAESEQEFGCGLSHVSQVHPTAVHDLSQHHIIIHPSSS